MITEGCPGCALLVGHQPNYTAAAGAMFVDPDTGGMRANVGKPKMHLVPFEVWRAALGPANSSAERTFYTFGAWFFRRPDADLSCAVECAVDLRRYAEILTKGAEKYAPRNWEKGLKFSNLFDSAARHFLAFLDGQERDPETGYAHVDHMRWNITAAWVFVQRGRTDLDDRPEPVEVKP